MLQDAQPEGDSWVPEVLATLLRDPPADWLRYLLPGLAGRAAQESALRSSSAPAEHSTERAASGGAASSSGRPGAWAACMQ